MEASELDCETTPAIKALGSLFSLTQVFLRGDCSAPTREIQPDSLNDETVSNLTMETTDEMELSRLLSALGLPISFQTSKRRNGMVKYEREARNRKHSYGHDRNEGVIDLTQLGDCNIAVDTEKVGHISGEEEYAENLNSSITCAAAEGSECQGVSRVMSDYSLNSEVALYSESSEVLDHDETESKVSDDSEVWASHWDSFYSRYYFYNTRTNESTWDPPPGMEHLAFGEVIDKPNEIICDTVENLGSQCSIDSIGECKTYDQSLDRIPSEPCLSSELASENFHSCMTVSTLDYSYEDLNEAQGIKKSCFEESSFNLLQDTGRNEITKLEKGISYIFQSQKTCAIHEEETEHDRVIIKQKKKPSKRTRLNRKLSNGFGELLFQGILEGKPEQKGMLEELSPSIGKYWWQRYLLFSRYDHGIKMDEEGWFSATPEPIAKHHALRCGDGGVVVDFFTGVGGNAIQFARRSKHVIAIDIDPKKIEYAQHNAAIYGVSDHIDFVVGDSFVLAPRLKADTVFLSPPWGGPNYLKATTFDINMMLKPHGGNVLFKSVKGIASKVVMFLPRTVDLNQLAELSLSVNPPWSLEVEKNFLNGKLKAITAYFSDTSC